MRNKKTYTTLLTLGLAVAGGTFVGCNRTGQGAAIGAGAGGAAGAGIGAVAGGKKGAAIGAIIGAVVGGTTGALIGRKMDQRAEQLRKDLEGAKVERVGEGILVTFESGILFDVDKAELRANAKENVGKLAEVLKRYDDTDIVIAGHTDDTGSADHNLELSNRRADTVAEYARSLGVENDRIRIVGEGENVPVAANTSTEGRQENRRVEIAIFANDDMKDELASNE
jgi:outer membrane protein OmpA-like peptidoglycan-associated protein